jgi:hypothetical protein
MPQTVSSPQVSQQPELPLIDWPLVLHELWASRRRVISAAAATGVVAALATFALSKMESEGLYQLYVPSLKAAEVGSSFSVGVPNFSEYKLISAMLAEPERMRDYLAARGLGNDDDVASLPRALQDPASQRQLLSPVYAYTKADAKEFADSPTAKESAGQVVGLRVAATAASAEVAHKRGKVLAEYVRDTVFLQAMTDYIRVRDSELKRSALAFENSVIGNRYQSKIATDRLRELKTVAQRNPDAARSDGRSVLSLTDSTTRFLPLSTQMMAADVSMVDLNLAFESAKRSRDQTEYTIAYFDALQKSSIGAKTAEAIIKAMPAAKAAADKGRDLADEKIKQVSNATQLEILTLEDAYYNRSRFAVGPTLPERSLKMPFVALVLGGLAGLVGMGLWIFMRKWFATNRETIFGASVSVSGIEK